MDNYGYIEGPKRDQNRVIWGDFGPILGRFGVILGSLRDRFGIVVASFWDDFGIVLESFLGLFCAFLTLLGVFWAVLGRKPGILVFFCQKMY